MVDIKTGSHIDGLIKDDIWEYVPRAMYIGCTVEEKCFGDTGKRDVLRAAPEKA